MQNHDSIRIKTETGDVWDVTLDDDELIFDEMHGSSRSVVPYSAIIDHDRLDELSPKTLGSYVKKAAQDSREASYASAADYERGNIGRHERGLEHSDKRQRGIKRAVDRLTKEEYDLDERAGPVGGGKWQDKMHLEEESDIESLISDLRKAYANINTIDPSSPTYKKLIDFLDGLDQEHLQILADAGVKFVSMLAKNRLKRSEKLDELSKDTLGSYAKKAHKSATGLATNAMHHMNTARELNNAGKDADKFYDYSTDATNKQIKRQKGIDRAVDKTRSQRIAGEVARKRHYRTPLFCGSGARRN
jgi:hypothetical protein